MRKKEARKLVHQLWKKYFKDDFDKPTIEFHDTKRQFGRADHTNHTLILSEKYIEQHENRRDIIDTIKHELAHFKVNSDGNGERPHGYEWRKIMRKIGATPERTRDNVDDVDWDPKYIVECKSCDWFKEYFRRGKAIKNINKCICPKCREKNLRYRQLR